MVCFDSGQRLIITHGAMTCMTCLKVMDPSATTTIGWLIRGKIAINVFTLSTGSEDHVMWYFFQNYKKTLGVCKENV